MPYLIKEDCRLYYETVGNPNNDAILMLHGNGEDGTIFKKQIDYFKEEYYVITMDMRGHGKSDLGNINLNFDVFARDVIDLLDFLQIKQVHILGFSDGGNTAITCALQYPNRIKKLIANGANLNPKGMKASVRYFSILLYYFVSIFALCFHSLRKRKQILGLMVHYPTLTLATIKQLSMPLLVLVGDKDMIKQEHSQSIAQYAPHGKLVILKGSHYILKECPQLYNQCVYNFLHEHL